MGEAGYKNLICYKLSVIAFQLGWEIVPLYYSKYEDGRQRDQIKQALRSLKQNIVEGASERSLSTKLKLYDVAKSSGMEALEDFEDILRMKHLLPWEKKDHRLYLLQKTFENFPSNTSNTTYSSFPSLQKVKDVLGVIEVIEAVSNYEIDLLRRTGYLLDRLINSMEEKHRREGGYSENLLKKRLEFRKAH